jgi:hypothetical protein
MPFTEEDAQNDGLIKREVGNRLYSVLSRKNSVIFQKFESHCEEYGLDPAEVLGDKVLKALRSDEFAESLSNLNVDMGQIQGNQVKIDDVELVQELMEKFDTGEDNDEDVFRDIIKERLKAVGGGPMGNMGQTGPGQQGGSSREVQQLRQEIASLRREINSDQQTNERARQQNTDQKEQDRQSIDEIIEASGGEEDEMQGGEKEEEQEQRESTETADFSLRNVGPSDQEPEGSDGVGADGSVQDENDEADGDSTEQGEFPEGEVGGKEVGEIDEFSTEEAEEK